jgi:hypothetical protein
MEFYSREHFAEATSRCWFMDDFGNFIFTPDTGLMMGFICGAWDF